MRRAYFCGHSLPKHAVKFGDELTVEFPEGGIYRTECLLIGWQSCSYAYGTMSSLKITVTSAWQYSSYVYANVEDALSCA